MAYIRCCGSGEMTRTKIFTYDALSAEHAFTRDYDDFKYLVVKYAVNGNSPTPEYREAMIATDQFALTRTVYGNDEAGWYFGGDTGYNVDAVSTIKLAENYSDKRHIDIKIGEAIGTGTSTAFNMFIPVEIYGLK